MARPLSRMDMSFQSKSGAASGEPDVPPEGWSARRTASAEAKGTADHTQVLALLHELGKELTSILDFEDLLRAAGQQIKRFVNYDMFSVLLVNGETERLEHAFSLRYDERIYPRTTLALGEGLCGTAAKERRSIRVDHVESDARYVRCEMGFGVRSEMVIPLLIKDRLLGVLDLESLEAAAFTEIDERLMVTLASTLAIALENARLYDEIRRAEQRKARDLERARQVQRALLPTATPEIRGVKVAARYVPALELGGDFYDFLPYGEGRLAVAVGDVAGKGSAAALLASLGIGLLREHAAQHPCDPEEMLADINGHLQIPGSNGQFVALTLAVYDGQKRELRISNAGFPPPLLVRDGRVKLLDIVGVPLGLFPDSSYDALQVALRPGDVVAFCSDGIHEQTNADDEQFGIRRLCSRLASIGNTMSAEAIADVILSATTDHAGPQRNCSDCHDDRTIVIMRVE
jgi:phosphoserine phosphatase RsbU/P